MKAKTDTVRKIVLKTCKKCLFKILRKLKLMPSVFITLKEFSHQKKTSYDPKFIFFAPLLWKNIINASKVSKWSKNHCVSGQSFERLDYSVNALNQFCWTILISSHFDRFFFVHKQPKSVGKCKNLSFISNWCDHLDGFREWLWEQIANNSRYAYSIICWIFIYIRP